MVGDFFRNFVDYYPDLALDSKILPHIKRHATGKYLVADRLFPMAVCLGTFLERRWLSDSLKRNCGRAVGFSTQVIPDRTLSQVRCIDVLHML